jgi:pilus assembly protein CpaB
MNKNILIVLGGGFLIAILVAVLVQSSLSGSKKQDDAFQKRVEILVAAKNLKTGNEIKSGDFKWQIWPEETLFVGAIIRDGDQSTTDAVSGKLLRSLVRGQPVHMTLVTEEDQGDFLSANIQKGMRAVGISVKSYVLADRLVRPGDFIDIMVTYKVRINSRSNPDAQSLVNRYATETVIENIRVLAIDKEDTKAVDEAEEDSGKKKKKKKRAKKATLTVEVTPEDAEKLMLSNKMGTLGIALRSIGDNSSPNDDKTTTDVKMSRVMTSLSEMRSTSSGVRIYNGTEMQDVQARNAKQESGVNFDLQSSPKFDESGKTSATVTFGPGALQELIQQEE